MASVINQIKLGSVEYAIAASAYAECSTAAATAAKVATICTDSDTTNTAFTLIKGVSIQVKFTATNSAANPTLSVNGTTASPIYYKGAAITASYLKANYVYTFVYDGTNWNLVGEVNTDSDTKTSAGSSNTSSKIFLVGATSQASSATTYSHDTVYVGTDGFIYSNGKKVDPDHTHDEVEYAATAGYADEAKYAYDADYASYADRAGRATKDSAGNSIVDTYATKASLATVATSGSYNDLSNKPTIPTVNNATLTIQKNGTNVATFTANSSTNATANITVPTGAAADKGVDTSISASSTSTNLPTSAAVAAFVEGKGYKTTDNNTTYTVATGDSNGQIKVTPSSGSVYNVSVKGLGSAAYTASTAYAAASHGTHVTADTVKSALGTSSTGTGFLKQDGTWATPTDTKYTHPTYTSKTSGLYKITVDGTGHVSGTAAVTKSDITGLGIPGSDTNTDAIYSGIGTCSTAASTAAKVVTMPKFALATNATILVRVSTTNSATSGVTLNVNSTGAKSIYIGGNAWSTSNQLNAGDYLATYDGTYWKLTRVYLTDNNTTYSAATQSANGLMSSTDKTKLDGIATGANNYSHPAGSGASKSSGLYKFSTDSTSHISGVTAVTKADITGLGIPAQDTTYSAATQSAAGLMSAADKTKLDGIASGANNYTYTLPTAGSTLGGVKTTSTVTSTSGLTACPIISGVPYYKDTNSQAAYGNITTSGTITSTAVTAATGVLVYDSNNKIQRATAAQTRSIIGAGTSNLTLGTTSTTAAAGNHIHENYGSAIGDLTTAVGDLDGRVADVENIVNDPNQIIVSGDHSLASWIDAIKDTESGEEVAMAKIAQTA